MTIDLPESLHMGSSVINHEYPYIEVNIPTLVPEEQGNTDSPLGKKCDTATADQPKTSWKPRITLTAEVKDLIGRGMMDDYDQELEHSTKAEVPSPEVVTSSPLKREKPVLFIGYPFSKKCSRDRSFWGKQPCRCFTHGSSP